MGILWKQGMGRMEGWKDKQCEKKEHRMEVGLRIYDSMTVRHRP